MNTLMNAAAIIIALLNIVSAGLIGYLVGWPVGNMGEVGLIFVLLSVLTNGMYFIGRFLSSWLPLWSQTANH